LQIDTILSFLFAASLLTVMPGPDIIFVLAQSVGLGKKYGIVTSLGLVSGILIHTSLIALGVSEAIKQSEFVFLVIKIFGALYLFYLAYKVYKSPAKIVLLSSEMEKQEFYALFKRGFFMNVLNPKVTIFFLAFFPNFINLEQGNMVYQIYFLGFLFMVQAFFIFSIVSVVSDRLTVFLRESKNFAGYLKVFQIIVFIGIGVFILI